MDDPNRHRIESNMFNKKNNDIKMQQNVISIM